MKEIEKKVRVQIDLAPQSYSRLAKLKSISESSSYTDVVKNALRVYEIIVEAERAGTQVFLLDPSGSRSEIRIVT